MSLDAAGVTQWIACDRCSKWRRVNDEYAKAVNDDDEWYCELNPDSEFANCDVPQELPDEQIDQEAAELAGSPAQAASSPQPTPPPDRDQQQQGQLPKLPAVIQLISENVFSHRKRKVQDEDDIMVCHCPPPWRGGDGCGPNCINRMLCIECTEDFCPCENQCNNQMFSRRQYAKVAVRRAGPKGHGLYTDEDLDAGQFIIQYVGEVLEEEEYLRRKHYYIQTGQRHYYFMNIGNGEVIDACRKGNVARFINHSCEPNCETQKWMVRGELAIGLFTLRKIKAGEELTFDYNFERYGDKPMRCFCGSKRCRKFIGGTQETTANIVELGDADDVTNDPAPVLVREDETDALVQAMLDKEVGTIQRGWDSKLLGRLQQLCRSKGIDWSYGADEAGVSASTQQAAANSSFAAEYQSEESSHAAGAALPAATAASPASSSAPATANFSKSGLDGAESRPKAARKPQKRKRKADEDPEVAAAAALKKQQQEERKRQRLLKQQERQQRQQQAFLRRQEQELQRLQRLRQQQLGQQPGEEQPEGQQQQRAAGEEGSVGEQQRGAAGKQGTRGSHESDLEDDMSSEDFQQQQGSEARDEGESEQSSSESEEEEEEEQPPQQQQKRPTSGRVKVVPARRLKPPLAPPRQQQQPKEQPAAPPAKRSFLTLAVSAPSRPVKKRSEVDRRLEQLVLKQSWKLKEPSKQSVIKVLRMFNLCDITPRQPDNNLLLQQQQQQSSRGDSAAAQQQQQQQQSDAADQQMGGAAVVDEAGLPALPAHLQPLQALKGAELEARERESEARFKARQRARMADMGMILDVVLASTSEKLKKEWVTCGILTQLQQALGRLPFTQEYSVVLVKVVGVLEHLPVTSDDLYTMRSAHGTFADLIRRMASSATDWEVRRRSHQLLKRYSAASCSDATLLQLYNLPGPHGKPYLLSLHLPQPQLARLTAMLPKSDNANANNNATNNAARRRVGRRNTPPPRGPPPHQLPPSGLWPPQQQPYGPPPGFGGLQQQQHQQHSEPHSSPSTSHGGPGGLPGAAAGGQQHQQEGGSSMAADSSGGWPPQQQQQHWDGSGLPPPPWAAGGGPPPHFPPPGHRPPPGGRHTGGRWQPGAGPPPPGYGGGAAAVSSGSGPPPRPGSSGALAPPSYGGPGPSPGGDWPSDAAGGAEGNAGGSGGAGGPRGGFGDRSPGGGEGGPPPPWGAPEWGGGSGRPPRGGDWEGRGGGGGRFGGPPPAYGAAGPYRERERQQRGGGWGDRFPEHDWEGGDYQGGGRGGREWDRDREPWGRERDEAGAHGGRVDPAAAKRQRRDGPGDGEQWPPPFTSPHDMPQHHRQMPPPGGWHGEPRGPWVSDLGDEPAPGERGWRQHGLDPTAAAAAAGGGRGGRESRWEERPQRVDPAADPAAVPPEAAAEDLFVLGVFDSAVGPSEWQAWSEAVGQQAAGAGEGAEPPLSPIVAGRFSPSGADGGGAGWGQARGNGGGGGAAGQPGRWGHGTPADQHHNQQQQQQYPDSWDQPGPDFEAFVCEAVKRRLGKYVQPDHPNRITKEEAQQLYKKLRRQIVDKEAAACAERQAAGSHKPIERSKLEANIKEFVRLSIRRLHTGRGGGGGGGAGGGGVNGMRV